MIWLGLAEGATSPKDAVSRSDGSLVDNCSVLWMFLGDVSEPSEGECPGLYAPREPSS